MEAGSILFAVIFILKILFLSQPQLSSLRGVQPQGRSSTHQDNSLCSQPGVHPDKYHRLLAPGKVGSTFVKCDETICEQQKLMN